MLPPWHEPSKARPRAAPLGYTVASTSMPTIRPRRQPPWQRASMAVRVAARTAPHIYSFYSKQGKQGIWIGTPSMAANLNQSCGRAFCRVMCAARGTRHPYHVWWRRSNSNNNSNWSNINLKQLCITNQQPTENQLFHSHTLPLFNCINPPPPTQPTTSMSSSFVSGFSESASHVRVWVVSGGGGKFVCSSR